MVVYGVCNRMYASALEMRRCRLWQTRARTRIISITLVITGLLLINVVTVMYYYEKPVHGEIDGVKRRGIGGQTVATRGLSGRRYRTSTELLNVTFPQTRRTRPAYPQIRQTIPHTKRKIWDISTSPTLDEELDNMRLPPFPFLKTVKNPCWIEAMPSRDGETRYNENIVAALYLELKVSLQRSIAAYKHTRAQKKQTLRLRCLPYYYIIGMTKCGTTNLNNIINKHPQVVKAPRKELSYWNRMRYTTTQPEPPMGGNVSYLYSRQTWPLKHYIDIFDLNAIEINKGHVHFNDSSRKPYFNKITGEASPHYLWDFDGWRKLAANKGLNEPRYVLAHLIKEVTPMAKIIVIVRDPVKRAWSEYLYFRAGDTKSPQLFQNFVLRGIKAWNNCTASNTPKYCAYDQNTNTQSGQVRLRLGLYYLYIQDWFETFGKDQFLLLRLEDWAVNQGTISKQIFQFLDIAPLYIKANKFAARNSNMALENMQILPETDILLKEFYRPWNEKLGSLMGDDKFNYDRVE